MIDLREAATRKIGPLPAWAWGAVVGGGLVIYAAVSGKGASSPFQQTLANADNPYDYGDGSGAGGGGGVGDLNTPVTPSATVGGNAGRRSTTPTPSNPPPTTNVVTPITPLVQSTFATRPGTGDTDPNPLPLGVTLPRAIAIADVQDKMARTFMEPPPIAPSRPIPIPGTVTWPTLPPIPRAQGDTRSLRDPRSWPTWIEQRAQGGYIPTTVRRPITVPPRIRAWASYLRPNATG